MDILAAEWLDSVDAPSDLRIYLVDKLLPTLVMGLEKVLREAEAKNLIATDGHSTALNPINFLAQYLMRNNPRFSNFAEASPYMMSMRVVAQELRERAYEMAGNRAAKLAAEVERRRKAAEVEELRQQQDWEERLQPILSRYSEWDDGDQGLAPALFVDSLKSFNAYLKQHRLLTDLNEGEIEVTQFLELEAITGDMESRITRARLIHFLGPIAEDLPAHIVDALAKHLNMTFGSGTVLEKAFADLYESFEIPIARARLQQVLQDFYSENAGQPDVVLVRPRGRSFSER